MAVWLDGILLHAPNMSSDKYFDLDQLSLAQIGGVEVYTSALLLPSQYGGRAAECGVILLWTKRGP